MWIINLQKSQAVWVSYLVSGSTEEDNRKTQHRAQPNAVSEFGLAGGKSADGSISVPEAWLSEDAVSRLPVRVFYHICSSSPVVFAETQVLSNVVTGMAPRSIYSNVLHLWFHGVSPTRPSDS